jgi:hypothetical protein
MFGFGRKHRTGDGDHLDELARRLDIADRQRSAKGRTFARQSFQQRHVTLQVDLAFGGNETLIGPCRNLSCGGLSLLLPCPLDEGTGVEALVPDAFKGPRRIRGTVARSVRIEPGAWEVGVRFESPLEMDSMGVVDPLAGRFTFDSVDPCRLRGRVLIFGVPADDAAILTSMLARTSLEIRREDSVGSDPGPIGAGVWLVVCDDDGTAARVRRLDGAAPIVVLTDDESPETRSRLRRQGASALMPRPITEPVLMRTLGEFLLDESQGSAAA